MMKIEDEMEEVKRPSRLAVAAAPNNLDTADIIVDSLEEISISNEQSLLAKMLEFTIIYKAMNPKRHAR